MKVLDEFREFAIKGNAVELAVGIIIGGAFTGIVNSLVKDILMPPIGYLTGGIDFSDLYINLNPNGQALPLEEARAAGAPVVAYGLFLNQLVSFLIVAMAVFLLIKAMNRLNRRAESEAPGDAEIKPKKEVQLLEEIRDALKKGVT